MPAGEKKHLRQQRLQGWIIADYGHMCEETPHSRAAGFLLRQVFDLLAAAPMDEVAPDVCELQRHGRLIQVQEQRGLAVCRRFLV